MSTSSHTPEGNGGSQEKLDQQHSDADNLLRKKEFGSELAKARRALSLTAADVADKLLVSEDIIRAIENSRTEDLPALTFTRGYIRSYARLVGVPAEKIISAYLSVAPDQTTPLSAHSALPVQSSSSNFFIKIISAGLVFLAVLFLFFKFYDTDAILHMPDTVQSDRPSPPAVTAEGLSSVGSSNNDSAAGTTDTVVAETSGSEVSDAARAAEGEQTGQISSLNNQVSTQPVKQPGPDAVKPDTAPQPHVSAVSDQAAEAETVVTLVLNAVDASWVEVKDATEQRLYYQLLNAGEQISLKGQPPYSIFLGNARQVRVEINNQIVDFAHLIKGGRKTVNMKVGDNAAVSLNLKR